MLIDCQMLYTCSTVRCVSVAVCSPCVMVADSRTFCLLGPVLFRLFNMTLRSFSKPRSKILKKHRKQSRKKNSDVFYISQGVKLKKLPVGLVQDQPANSAEGDAQGVFDMVHQTARRGDQDVDTFS